MPSPSLEPAEAALTTTWARSELSAGPLRIIPKGLGSFDEHDADFFLELLPGPRDREGLPDGLRFWKTRIEATDPDKTFRVGMIYGPSGSGKSSLVKAGLLPRLGKHVAPVYLEATTGETVARLLRGIKKAVPGLPERAGLVDSFLALRRGYYLRQGRKVLVVLDQFEQWLFGRRHDQGDELLAALRQCDGEKIQVLCLVRDDFWMAATRFSRDLEIDLVPDRNIAAVDLFEPKHARKVLAAFGRAYEALPPGAGDLAKEQHAFLDQSIAALARWPGRTGTTGSVCRDGQGQALDSRHAPRRRGNGRRGRQISRRDSQLAAVVAQVSLPPECRAGSLEVAVVGNEHRFEGSDAIDRRTTRRFGLRDEARRFQRPAPDSRQ